ncbi:MAG: hypothetical protein A2Y14_01005 [Verrucomicrobia bacterium GWF2_51_19]|nr:MAG: hypothetical protein A2Y14_01005 [Verrucomicrobia bacterium GWF2_51_19]HCJ12061.1 hypothetical protein [Opitutae bacterium]
MLKSLEERGNVYKQLSDEAFAEFFKKLVKFLVVSSLVGFLLGFLVTFNDFGSGWIIENPWLFRLWILALGIALMALLVAINARKMTAKIVRLTRETGADLEQATAEILALNERLKQENLKLGADIEITKQLQTMILPDKKTLQSVEGLDIAGFMHPADEVGGDYYDILFDKNLIKIGIGDVTGHGIESGVLMIMVQTVARALLDTGEYDPVRFLNQLNKTLFQNVARIQTDKNLTLLFADYKDNSLTLTGQHEDVLIVRRGGTLERISTVDLGFPIGLEEDITHFVKTLKVPFNQGDVAVFYTDGITEAENDNGKMYGLDRLCNCLQTYSELSSTGIKDAIIRDLMLFIRKQRIYDDITLVVVKHK